MLTIRKILTDDNIYPYQTIKKELNLGSAAIHKIFHVELHLKKLVCRRITHGLTKHQKWSVSKSAEKKDPKTI